MARVYAWRVDHPANVVVGWSTSLKKAKKEQADFIRDYGGSKTGEIRDWDIPTTLSGIVTFLNDHVRTDITKKEEEKDQ
jgi:hypothetical protein